MKNREGWRIRVGDYRVIYEIDAIFTAEFWRKMRGDRFFYSTPILRQTGREEERRSLLSNSIKLYRKGDRWYNRHHTNLMNFMNCHKNFIIRGIGAAAAVVTVLPGCASIPGQDKAALQDYVGNWQFVSARHGNKTDNPNGGIQFENSDGRIIGGIPGGVLELKPVDKRKLEGTFWLFGAAEKAIRVPATVEIAENKQELNLVMMTSKVDKTSLPTQLKEQFSEDFTFVAKRQTASLESSLSEQSNKARQAEARQNVGAMNRAQQAYFLEKNSFASNLQDLGVGIKPETENFSYSLNLLGETGVQTIATPRKEGFKSYTGGVFVVKDERSNEALTMAKICESEQPSQTPPAPPQLIGKEIQCPSGFRDLSK